MIQFNNVSFKFPHSNDLLLDNVSFEISKANTTAIIGLNGSGKTTLLKLMSGFLKPHSGIVNILDKEISLYSNKNLAQVISHIPQSFPTSFPYTVFEFAMMGRYPWQKELFPAQEDYDIVHKILKKLNLEQFKSRLIQTLSGGEKQKLLLARALVQNTQIILLDEPFNHLDLKNKLFFMEQIKTLRYEYQKTVITVLHDIEIVKRIFENTILLKNGKIKFHGDTKELTKESIYHYFGIDEIQLL